MIRVTGLGKSFGAKRVLEDVSFTVPNGQVTGFLGPNGAGKTTTMRIILGLSRPASGSVSIDDVDLKQQKHAGRLIGALLDQRALIDYLSVRDMLTQLALSQGIAQRRVDEVIDIVGLGSARKQRVKTLSLGMRQRVGIAAALLGDPPNLMFDEPVNGLDPDGVRWVREVSRRLARAGKAVLVSSHLMSEMAQTADRVVVLGRGRVLTEMPLEQLLSTYSRKAVRVTALEPERFQALAGECGWETRPDPAGTGVVVVGQEPAEIFRVCAARGLVLTQLSSDSGTLEDAFFELTNSHLEYRAEAVR